MSLDSGPCLVAQETPSPPLTLPAVHRDQACENSKCLDIRFVIVVGIHRWHAERPCGRVPADRAPRPFWFVLYWRLRAFLVVPLSPVQASTPQRRADTC